MSQESQSCLRFSIEESLWFRKGQEVAELVSISLDPDITIQENDQYVTIRGSLELTGEYNSYNEVQAEEEEVITTQKYIQSVEERDGGVCEFSHRFPVDITIPNNRIQSIYDIDVLVESFDYTIPERSCLKLSAELTISGLYGDKQNEATEDANLELLYRNNVNQNGGIELNPEASGENNKLLFEAEARKMPEEESMGEPVNFPTFSYQEANMPNGYADQERWKIGKKQAEEVIEESPMEIVEEEIIIVEESSSSSSKEESPPKQEEVKKASKKKSMSLTEFFARKEGEDDKIKLKICIVQKGDTLDRLAERYNLSIQNLLKVNHLEYSQDVSEGQVLYIPVESVKK